ncbi:MAG: FUSC family protein [Pseudonocardiales bacterium]|nr:FUSC family protein [Pseudonocardiales bacterium]
MPVRTRLRKHLRTRVRRVGISALPIVQCAVAAGLAWFVAGDVVGHARPFFAPIAAVISLGLSLSSRLRRVVELVVGVSLGVLVGDLLISVIGSGAWQIALVVALAMGVAVFADGATLLVAQAGSSAVLVATLLPPGDSSGLDRCLDALIGGVIGVAVAAVLPADPVAPARRAARALLDELAGVLLDSAAALRDRDPDAAAAALARARASQPLIDELRTALRGGREITTVAPLYRRRRGVLGRYADLAERADYAMRNTRVLARRTYQALCDDEPAAPELADALRELAGAVGALTAQLGRDGERERAREPVLEVVRHAVALSDTWVPGPSEQVIVAQLRSIALDLLQATGLSRSEALAAMRSRG